MLQRMKIVLPALALMFCTEAFARGDDLANIALQWTPSVTIADMGPLDVDGALRITPIHFEAFTDQRQNPSLVGENREDAAKVRPVTTSTSVPTYLSTHMSELARASSLYVTDTPNALHLTAEVRRFLITETDSYRGQFSLLFHLRDGKGKEVWSGTISGGALNFGRSYKADNYNETLSNMVVQATYNLLANSALRDALEKQPH
jgi:hypothetical protein